MGVLNIPQLPKYKATLPSTGKDIYFRPITYREESFLLQLNQVKETDVLADNILNIVDNCLYDVDRTKLTTTDITWLFLQIRKASISDTIEVGYRCLRKDKDGKECDTLTPYIININDVKVEGDREFDYEIDLGEGAKYKLYFSEPPYLENKEKKETIDVLYAFFNRIENLEDGNVYTKEDISEDEFKELFMNVPIKDVVELASRRNRLYRVTHKGTWKCSKCGNTEEIVTEGLFDFFG